MKSFSYSPFFFTHLNVSIRSLISSQSFANFANIILLTSVEVKTKYLFPLFSLIYPSASPMIRYNGFKLLILSQSSVFFYCDVINIIVANIFEDFLSIFIKLESKYLILKVFNMSLKT